MDQLQRDILPERLESLRDMIRRVEGALEEIADCSVESIMFSADSIVIPQSAPCTAHDAKAGIQNPAQNVDSRFRGNDDDAASKIQAAMFSTEQSPISNRGSNI